jgi:hypothetical protein
MRKLAVAVCLLLACSPLAFAQDKKDAPPKKEPTAAQKKQQERMKECNEQAGAKKMEAEARKKFVSECLKGEKMSPQQERMKSCNKQASDKKMKGDERKKFMSECLKG